MNQEYFSIFSNSLIQATTVFIFLTIFFFTYVSKVEKTEFQDQITDVVDEIWDENADSIKRQFPSTPHGKNVAKTVVYGLIDSSEEYLEKNNSKQDIDDKNNKIIINSVLTILIVVIVIVIVFIISGLFGYYVPFSDVIQESLFILVFVALTEYIFLITIVENYTSLDSDDVKTTIAKGVVDYINQR